MQIARRTVLTGLIAAPAIIAASRRGLAADAKVLKISHQFPGGTIDQGDFRDRMVRLFAQEVEKKTNGALKFEIYPGSSLMKTNSQFSALRKGALDLSLYPLAYAGGEVQEVNIGLMPCLVTSYDQGLAWKKAPIGVELAKLLDDKGVKILTWIWQAGGTASRAGAVVAPDDVKEDRSTPAQRAYRVRPRRLTRGAVQGHLTGSCPAVCLQAMRLATTLLARERDVRRRREARCCNDHSDGTRRLRRT